jgi:hypothetical protein
MALQIRRGTSTEVISNQFVPAEGELIYTTDTKRVFVGDGFTIGGVDITSSGGTGGALTTNLDLNNQNITGIGDISISGLIVTDSEFRGDLRGNVIGDLAGNVVGTVTGELEGSVFGAGSTLLVDGDNNLIVGDVSGSIINEDGEYVLDNRASFTPMFYGSVSGDVIGDLYGSIIANDSVVLVNSDTATLGTVNLTMRDNYIICAGLDTFLTGDTWKTGQNNVLFIGDENNPNSIGIHTNKEDALVMRGIYDEIEETGFSIRFQGSRGSLNSPLPVQVGDRTGGIIFSGLLESTSEYEMLAGLTPIMETVTSSTFEASINLLIINAGGQQKTAGLYPDGSFRSAAFLPKPYANPTARNTAIPTPVAGMIVFLTDSTGAGGAPKFQGNIDGTVSGWVNLNP